MKRRSRICSRSAPGRRDRGTSPLPGISMSFPRGDGWASEPFAPATHSGGIAYGRGAVDMKGAIAAMVAAVADVPADAGTISFIITGDEEGPATHGTRALID